MIDMMIEDRIKKNFRGLGVQIYRHLIWRGDGPVDSFVVTSRACELVHDGYDWDKVANILHIVLEMKFNLKLNQEEDATEND